MKVNKISTTFLMFMLMISSSYCQQNGKESFYVVTWNVENLFDTVDDPLINDQEFLPGTAKDWNESRFETKLENITKVINYMNEGCGPDIIALQEVENINVLKSLSYNFKDRDYIMAHRDSPDERGIDVCLLYDRNVFDIVEIIPIKISLPSKSPTRDILHVKLMHKNSKTELNVFVNHWSSRRGGVKTSEPNRIETAKTLKEYLNNLEGGAYSIILGDFNDEPSNTSIENILGAKDFPCSIPAQVALLNLSYKKYKNDEGSYLFQSSWDMIDQIIVSQNFLDGANLEYECDSFSIIKPFFMIEKEGSRKNGPKPTYRGNEYVGGYSDHFPIGAKFYFN